MRTLPIAIVVALAAPSCGSNKESAAKGAPPDEAAAKAAKRVPQKPRVERKAARAVLRKWLAAQNDGKFDDYKALYSENFSGVRRSGKQTVRLDRTGWLADRARMFKKKVAVKADRVQIAVGVDVAKIKFVQDWSSGTYRDVGPKLLSLENTPSGLRIAREVMLASTLVNAPKDVPESSAHFALVHDGMIVIATEPETEGTGSAKLVSGTVPAVAPECADVTYEDQDKYWPCHDAENHTDQYVARRAVELPKLAKLWTGKKLALFDGSKKLCEVVAGDLSLHAEWETEATSVGSSDDDSETLAQAVLEGGTPVLVAALDGDLKGACKGAAFARDAALPDPAMLTMVKADASTAKLVSAELSQREDVEASKGWRHGRTVSMRAIGKRYIAVAIESDPACGLGEFLFFVYKRTKRAGEDGNKVDALELVFEHTDGPGFALRGALDLTGDHIPELVTSTGLIVWGGDEFDYLPLAEFESDLIDQSSCEGE